MALSSNFNRYTRQRQRYRLKTFCLTIPVPNLKFLRSLYSSVLATIPKAKGSWFTHRLQLFSHPFWCYWCRFWAVDVEYVLWWCCKKSFGFCHCGWSFIPLLRVKRWWECVHRRIWRRVWWGTVFFDKIYRAMLSWAKGQPTYAWSSEDYACLTDRFFAVLVILSAILQYSDVRRMLLVKFYAWGVCNAEVDFVIGAFQGYRLPRAHYSIDFHFRLDP